MTWWNLPLKNLAKLMFLSTTNVVGPGLTLTDATVGQPKEVHEQVAAITPLRRIGMPEDIAGVVLFLASSLSDYLNGEYIPVTGGNFMI
jgi:3-oxoacyl-[acyl-carrier protein] reductase